MNRILGLFIVVFSISSQSEVLHWPQVCSSGELILKNRSGEDLSVWLQNFSSQIASSAVEAHYRCNGVKYKLSSLQGGELTFRKTNTSEPLLWVQNIFSGQNNIQLELLNAQFKSVGRIQLQLQPNEYKKINSHTFGTENSSWSFIRVRSSEKYTAFSLTDGGLSSPVMIEPVKTEVSSAPAYFLVGSRGSDEDNFIVPISNPQLIAEARQLVAHPQREKILFATVQKNHHGVNRNWSKTEKSFWSWSVNEVTSFGDLGSTSCNGTPQFVEDRASAWVEYVGRICFWSYRVKKELTPAEVASGKSR
jgi:hypothetical protein